MKNKKGFTIVELVIVIAVIAILAGVLIPTFSGVVEKANKSAAYQSARNEYSMYMAYAVETGMGIQKGYIQVEKGNKEYWFAIEDGSLNSEVLKAKPTTDLANNAVDLSTLEIKSVTIATSKTAAEGLGVKDQFNTAVTTFYKAANCAEEYALEVLVAKVAAEATKATEFVSGTTYYTKKSAQATDFGYLIDSNKNEYEEATGLTAFASGTDYFTLSNKGTTEVKGYKAGTYYYTSQMYKEGTVFSGTGAITSGTDAEKAARYDVGNAKVHIYAAK